MKPLVLLALSCIPVLAACGSDGSTTTDPTPVTGLVLDWQGAAVPLPGGVTGSADTAWCTWNTNAAGALKPLFAFATPATVSSNQYAALITRAYTTYAFLVLTPGASGFGTGECSGSFHYFYFSGTNHCDLDGAGTFTVSEYGAVGGHVAGTFAFTNATLTVVSNTNTGGYVEIGKQQVSGAFRFQRLADYHPLFRYWDGL